MWWCFALGNNNQATCPSCAGNPNQPDLRPRRRYFKYDFGKLADQRANRRI
jgi:hypothetical protein